MADDKEIGIMKRAAVYGVLVIVALIYGAWALVAKIAIQDGANPMIFAFYRCVGGTLILFVAMLFAPNLACANETSVVQKVMQIPKHDILRFAMLGVFMALNICGFILGASKLSALTVSVFQPTIPVFAMIFSVIFGVEQISMHKFAGVMFMIAGAVCVATFGETANAEGAKDNASIVTGILSLLMNVSGTGLYFVHNKDVVRTYEPVFATAMTYAFSAVIILVATVCLVGFDSDKWMLERGEKAWLGLAYAVVATTAINYSLLSWANRHSGPVMTSVQTTLQPVMAGILSLIILGVGFSTGQMAGAAFIIAGLLVMVRGQVLEGEEEEQQQLIGFKPAVLA